MTASEWRCPPPHAPAHHASLDGLRAVAVALVVLFHAGATSGLPGLAARRVHRRVGVLHDLGVPGDLDPAARGRARRTDRRDRLRSLLGPPGQAAVAGVAVRGRLAVVLLSSWAWNGMQASDAIAGVFGYTNWYVIWSGEDELLRTIVGPLGPYWSLAIEEQFYVLLTVAFVALLAHRPPDAFADGRRRGRLVRFARRPAAHQRPAVPARVRDRHARRARSSPDAAWPSSCTSVPSSPTGAGAGCRRPVRSHSPSSCVIARDERLRPAVAAARRLQRPLAGQRGARAVVARSRTASPARWRGVRWRRSASPATRSTSSTGR